MRGNIGERHQNLKGVTKLYYSIAKVLASSSLQMNSKCQMQSKGEKIAKWWKTRKILTCLGAGCRSQRYTNISRQMATRSALVIAFDSRVKPWIMDVKRSLETYSMSSAWFVTIARTTNTEQYEEILVTDSPSVHVKASKHSRSVGRARTSCFRRKLSHKRIVKNKAHKLKLQNMKELKLRTGRKHTQP